jgi:lysophospholipase L1-like esterase
MVGSNDVTLDYQMDGAEARLDSLVSEIFALLPQVHLVLAELTGLTDGVKDLRALSYNEKVRSVALAHLAAGEHVTVVDMHAAVPLSDMADEIHPNDAGYQKMAAVWFDVLVP